MNRFVFLSGLIILVFLVSLSLAEIPRLINYQGMLTQSGETTPVPDDNYNLTFKIYGSLSGVDSLWWEYHTGVPVTSGLFNVLLGSISTLSSSLFDDSVRYLGIAVGTDAELSPRIRLASVAYSFRSQWSDTADYAEAGADDNDWTFRVTDTADTTLITGGAWGIARYGNVLHGTHDSTHVNLGVACTTGESGQNYKYCTVGGGKGNTASQYSATVGGGEYNTASQWYATVGGGRNNTASIEHATVAGGGYNTASGEYNTIGGGYKNFVEGEYSAILGGYADTITSSADYSYLFGIGSKLTGDSTFMVDMPHVRFGDETNGYEFPTTDGTNGQVMATDGSGQLSWITGAGDNDWTFRVTDTADTTLMSGGEWGIARYGNTLYGNADSTHVNFGVACTTGASGQNYKYCTVGGGLINTASGDYATVGGGRGNTASSRYATVGGGVFNTASDWYATIGGGYSNTASNYYATIGGGVFNTASGIYATVPGGSADTAAGDYSFATGREVRVTGAADYTFAFGRNFTTATPNAVIFHNSSNEIKVGIGVTNPGNILTVQQGSTTDPIADSWTTHPCDSKHKNIIREINPHGYLDGLRNTRLVEWTRKTTPEQANLPKFRKKSLGPLIDDPSAPKEIMTFDENGNPNGIDLLSYCGYLHTVMKEASMVIEAQQEQIDALKGEIERIKSGGH